MTAGVTAAATASESTSGGPAPRTPAQQHLTDFLAHLTHERRLAVNTVSSYARDITALIQLAGASPLDTLQVHQIRRYAAQLHARGLDGRSIARMLSAWRGFYRYLARDRGFGANPCLGIRAPKAVKRLPHALSPDESSRLLAEPAAPTAEKSGGTPAISLPPSWPGQPASVEVQRLYGRGHLLRSNQRAEIGRAHV